MTVAGDEDAPTMADLMAAKTGEQQGPRAVKFDVYFSFSTS
jgi:CHASE2 domain-containing sensor protein